MLLNARSTADMQCIKIEIEKVIHQFDQQRFWQQPFAGEGKKKQWRRIDRKGDCGHIIIPNLVLISDNLFALYWVFSFTISFLGGLSLHLNHLIA